MEKSFLCVNKGGLRGPGFRELAHGPQDGCGFGRWDPSRAGSLSEAALPCSSRAAPWQWRGETPSQEFQLCRNAGSILSKTFCLRKKKCIYWSIINLQCCVSGVQQSDSVIHTYIYIHTHTHTHIYMCIYMCIYTHTYICTHIYMYIYVCIYMCVHIYTYIYSHIYIYL